MGTVLNSLDNMHASAQQNGVLSRVICDSVSGATAATIASGYTSGWRSQRTFTVPAMGGSLSGAYLVNGRISVGVQQQTVIIAQETLLGTLTVSGNSFASGSTMPIKTNPGDRTTTIQTATEILAIIATTTLTATTPTLTITYTNQDGNTGQTAILTLPTNPSVNSLFLVNPHLAYGDTGVQAVTNMSISTGSAGVLKAYGLLVLAASSGRNSNSQNGPSPLVVPNLLWKLVANDVLAVYGIGTQTGAGIVWTFTLVGDN